MIRDLNTQEIAQINGGYQDTRSTGSALSGAYGTTAMRSSWGMAARPWGAMGGVGGAVAFNVGWAIGTRIYNRNAVRIQDTLERLFR